MEELRKIIIEAIERVTEDSDLSTKIKEISLDWKTFETMTSIEIRPVIKIEFYNF